MAADSEAASSPARKRRGDTMLSLKKDVAAKKKKYYLSLGFDTMLRMRETRDRVECRLFNYIAEACYL